MFSRVASTTGDEHRSSSEAALISSATARRAQGRHPRPSGSVWALDWRVLPRHRRSSEKTALDWHSYASCQSDVHQLRRQSRQCSWTSRLELSADESQTAGLVIQPVSDSRWKYFTWSMRTNRSVNPTLNGALEIL